jgi:hypothetical protein
MLFLFYDVRSPAQPVDEIKVNLFFFSFWKGAGGIDLQANKTRYPFQRLLAGNAGPNAQSQHRISIW